jgi:hypothetical protein
MSGLFGGRAVVVVTGAPSSAGDLDQSFPTNPFKSDFSPTGEKPQSKLWWNDGRWWASMLHTDSKYYIFYLDGQTWTSTGTLLDDRIATQADCLWDDVNKKLYVASGGGSVSTGADLDAKLFRYSYNDTNQTYTLDAGFPVTIRFGGAETIVIDKDSTGQLWTSYTQGSRVWINRTLTPGVDTAWGAPFNPPNAPGEMNSAVVAGDDISSLVAFDGKAGVLWSKQTPAGDPNDTFYFAYHNDNDPDTTWETRIAYRRQGGDGSDDHINLKSLQAVGGDVFAVVKTSISGSGASDPRLLVLRRESNGNWSSSVFVNQSEGGQEMHHTRPILMVDSVNRELHVFATLNDTSGIAIVHKKVAYPTTGLDDFPAGVGADFIRVSGAGGINNPTASKQVIDGANGINSIVILASDAGNRVYAHNVLPLTFPDPTNTPTNTPTATATNTPTNTPTATATNTPTATRTPTATPRTAPEPQMYLPFVKR